MTQRIYQIGCGYEDGNDANSLRHDPMFKLGAACLPFDDDAALASGATISRFEHAAGRQDIYRVSEALIEQFIASFSTPPESNDQLSFTLKEGKKRQIRRMCDMVGLKVLGLKRVHIGKVKLGDLPVGQWRYLLSISGIKAPLISGVKAPL